MLPKISPNQSTFADKILIYATNLVTPYQVDSHGVDRGSKTSVDEKLVDTGSLFGGGVKMEDCMGCWLVENLELESSKVWIL